MWPTKDHPKFNKSATTIRYCILCDKRIEFMGSPFFCAYCNRFSPYMKDKLKRAKMKTDGKAL